MIKNRKQLIQEYINFFKSKNHKEALNASLIPENDPTVLFTTAGMHPLVPYLLGQEHPLGKRLVNNQKCIRTQDIEDVGDAFHHTFFEMLGNWSLGDYWKKEAIEYTFEFLTKILKIPKQKLAITCFRGDKNVRKDTESAKIWESLGIPKERIAFLVEDNWWGPAGKTGPCGPCTEMFYWKAKNKPPKKFNPKDENWVEIGNDVLMEYNKDATGYHPAKQKNIDFGGGTERLVTVLLGLEDDYLAPYFLPIIKKIEQLSKKKYGKNKEITRAMRIIADHIKAAVMILNEGIPPSNLEQGYVLRRLIRRSIRYAQNLNIKSIVEISEPIFNIYNDYNLNKDFIKNALKTEEEKFLATLKKGLKILEKIFKKKEPIDKKKFSKLMKNPNKALLIGRVFEMKKYKKNYSIKQPKISKKEIDGASIKGKESFLLYQSYGFPLEMIDELAMAKGFLVDHHAFRTELKKHQKLSRTATQGKFKSGLADNSKQVKKLHTATHLLNQALRVVLKKPDIFQKGSNITPERLRFDFNFDRKLTPDEIKKVEELVNKKIKEKIPIKCEFMTPKQAEQKGAQGVFRNKYGEKVSVYSVGSFSKEICAGPHVSNTGELGKFKIIKEESSAAGVRRIKAVLE